MEEVDMWSAESWNTTNRNGFAKAIIILVKNESELNLLDIARFLAMSVGPRSVGQNK